MSSGYLGPTVWLTALWVGLWRSTTPATIITGVVLAVALTWAVRRSDAHREHHRVRPLALLRYFAHMGVALVKSNIVLAREILTPTDYTRPGILEIRLPPCSELILTVIANSITLTPGTLTLELRMETSTLVVHVLHLRDADAARAEVEELHRLVSTALVRVPRSKEATAG